MLLLFIFAAFVVGAGFLIHIHTKMTQPDAHSRIAERKRNIKLAMTEQWKLSRKLGSNESAEVWLTRKLPILQHPTHADWMKEFAGKGLSDEELIRQGIDHVLSIPSIIDELIEDDNERPEDEPIVQS